MKSHAQSICPSCLKSVDPELTYHTECIPYTARDMYDLLIQAQFSARPLKPELQEAVDFFLYCSKHKSWLKLKFEQDKEFLQILNYAEKILEGEIPDEEE